MIIFMICHSRPQIEGIKCWLLIMSVLKLAVYWLNLLTLIDPLKLLKRSMPTKFIIQSLTWWEVLDKEPEKVVYMITLTYLHQSSFLTITCRDLDKIISMIRKRFTSLGLTLPSQLNLRASIMMRTQMRSMADISLQPEGTTYRPSIIARQLNTAMLSWGAPCIQVCSALTAADSLPKVQLRDTYQYV